MTRKTIRTQVTQKRNRMASQQWRAIIREATTLEHYSKTGFSYSDVLSIAKQHNVSIKPESLRVKLERYRKRGFLEKISRGRFQIPISGYNFFDPLGLKDKKMPSEDTG